MAAAGYQKQATRTRFLVSLWRRYLQRRIGYCFSQAVDENAQDVLKSPHHPAHRASLSAFSQSGDVYVVSTIYSITEATIRPN